MYKRQAWRIANDFFAEPVDAQHWRWRELGYSIELPLPMRALGAPVQLRNAACAIAALRALDLQIDDAAIVQGVAHAEAVSYTHLDVYKRQPYSTTVEVEKFEEEPSPKTGVMYRIDAVIWVEREGQKAIVIGKGGERLRDIGKHARMQMERLFGAKVFLQTWVRVREGWSDDEAALRALGYHD